MFVPKFSLAYLTPCWKPQLNFSTAGACIPPIKPNSDSFICTAAATPAKKPASCSAKRIDTVLSPTTILPSASLGDPSKITNFASGYFS